MKKFIILLIIIAGIFLIYRGWGSNDRSQTTEQFRVTLVAQNQSGVQGETILSEVDGQVKVMINLTGSPVGVSQPAHVHLGSCAALGEPIYALSSVTDGVSETTLTASFEALKVGLPLAINVHKSATEMVTSVACGDIVIE